MHPESLEKYKQQELLKSYIDEQNRREDERIQKEREVQNLTDMIKLWKKIFPEIEIAEETGNPNKFHLFDTSFILKIENHPFFKSRKLFNYCSGLEDVWIDFRRSIHNYSLEKQKVTGLIESCIVQQLKSQNFNTELEIKKGFYLSIYRELIVKAKGEISLYDYIFDPNQFIQLRYCRKADGGGFLPENIYDLAIIHPKEKHRDVKYIHKELIKKCKKPYSKEIQGIIKMERETVDKKKELDDMLEKIIIKENLLISPLPLSDNLVWRC